MNEILNLKYSQKAPRYGIRGKKTFDEREVLSRGPRRIWAIEHTFILPAVAYYRHSLKKSACL